MMVRIGKVVTASKPDMGTDYCFSYVIEQGVKIVATWKPLGSYRDIRGRVVTWRRVA